MTNHEDSKNMIRVFKIREMSLSGDKDNPITWIVCDVINNMGDWHDAIFFTDEEVCLVNVKFLSFIEVLDV